MTVSANHTVSEEQLAKLEGLVRTVLSAQVGTTTKPTGSKVVNGRTVTDTRKDPNGVVYVGLEDYADCYGAALNKNVEVGRAAWNIGGKPFLVLLGSEKIKVGDDWQSLGVLPIIAHGRWYVPLDALERLVR